MTIYDFLSKNPAFAWTLFTVIILLCVALIRMRYKIQIWPPKLTPPSEVVDAKNDEKSRIPAEVTSSQSGNDSWEYDLKKAIFPEKLKRILAYNVAEKLKGKVDDPDTLLAVQRGGQWLAEYLAEWLPRKPKIIFVEKKIHQDHVREYLKIPVKRVEETINLFVSYNDIDQISGKIVVVDDFIRSGETVRNLVEQLKLKNKNIIAVATVCVTNKNLEDLQNDLKINEMALVYLMKSEGALL